MSRLQWLILACPLLSLSQISCNKSAPEAGHQADQSHAPSAPDFSGLNKGLGKLSFDVSKTTIESQVALDLQSRTEGYWRKLKDAFDAWRRDEQAKAIRDGLNDAYWTSEKKLQKRSDVLRDRGSEYLKEARRAAVEKVRAASDAEQLARTKKQDLSSLREALQKNLDADLTAFLGEVEAARSHLRAAALGVSDNHLVPEILSRIKQLKTEAAASQVVWDSSIDLRPEDHITLLYLARLYQAGLVKELPQRDIIRIIDVSLKTSDDALRRSALDLCLKIDDVVVFARLATKEALRSAEFRKVVVIRLPALVEARGINGIKEDVQRLMARLADSYLADPQPSHSAELDRAVNAIQDNTVRYTPEFVWLLAGAALSGSQDASRDLYALFVSAPAPSHDLLYLHRAAQRRQFNSLVGTIVAKRAGKDPVAVFHRSIGTIVTAKKGFDLFSIPDLSDFLIGWFAAVDASFAPEALRIYKLVFEDPERRKLEGHEQVLGGFEAFRVGAICFLLRSPEGLAVEFLYRLDKLQWQSERVAAATTLQALGALDKVEVDTLSGIVDDPWKGTAAYRNGLLPSDPARRIGINEWILFASALEQRSKDAAVAAYRRAFLGQSAIRTSRQGDKLMYPFRVYALRRLLALKPDVFPELVQYAATEKCPGTLRRALLCEYAADHERIGNGYVEKIPAALPRDGLSPLSSRYVDGMLRAFEVVRTGKEPSSIKSAEPETIRGYAYTLLSYDQPELAKIALAALRYKSMRPEPPGTDVAIDLTAGSEITAFHFMTRDSLLRAVRRLSPNIDPERVADEYAKWAAKVWSREDDRLPATPEQIRKAFVTEHRLLDFRPDQGAKAQSLRQFEADPRIEKARRITSDWPSYTPASVRQALKILISDKNPIDEAGNLVSSVATGLPSATRGFDRAPNDWVLRQLRAEVLEVLFADLQNLEAGLTDANSRRRFQNQVTRPLMRLLEKGPGKQP